MSTMQWLEPAPLWTADWGVAGGPERLRPLVSELDRDDFVDDFRQRLLDDQTDLGGTAPATRSARGVTLFHPMAQRYYLVSGSLVCRKPGIPDHTVSGKHGESVGFIVRRLSAQGEQAWVQGPTPGWEAATSADLRPGEEVLPAHGAPARPRRDTPVPGSAHHQPRVVHFGYIQVGSRSRYRDKLAAATIGIGDPQAADPADRDLRLSQFMGRVATPIRLLDGPAGNRVTPWPEKGAAAGMQEHKASFYILVELATYLWQYLPAVMREVSGTPNPQDPPKTEEKALLDELGRIWLTRQIVNGQATPLASPMTLRAALKEFSDPVYAELLGGIGDEPANPLLVDLRTVKVGASNAGIWREVATGPDAQHPLDDTWLQIPGSSTTWTRRIDQFPSWLGLPTTDPASADRSLAIRLRDALSSRPAPAVVAPELASVLTPAESDDPDQDDWYVLRMVYQRRSCPPVLSEPTEPVRLAAIFEPGAPARPVKVALPDPAHLRRMPRSVAFEMPPALRRIVNRVTPDLLKGGDLGDDPGLGLGMICSFSIAIVMLIAFILMMVVALLLNLVFWWMPFLRICLPIPKKE